MSVPEVSTRVANEFRALCGAEHVVEDPFLLDRYQVHGVTPGLVISPASPEEVVAVLRIANEHGLSVVPAGGFTQQHAGNKPADVDVVVVTARWTDVEHYDAGDLTVGVGAGCTVAQLGEMVANDHLFFAMDTPLPGRSTIGGVLATAAQGPLRQGYGGPRDFCIGIRFVTGDARQAKSGGRVVKNVAGYDVMKLLIGSQGTLGIITSASFKLFPAPRQTRTYLAEFRTPGEALEFRGRVLNSPLSPMCLELVSPGARQLLRPGMAADSWVVCVRGSGSDAVQARYRSELGSAVTREIEAAGEHEMWRALADFSDILHQQHHRALLVSLSLKLRDVLPAIGKLVHVAEANDLEVGVIGRVGVGHLQAGFWPSSREVTLVNFVNAVSALRAGLPAGSSMVVQRCPPEAQHHVSAWGPTPTHVESMRAVKNALDPKDILNRGRFLF